MTSRIAIIVLMLIITIGLLTAEEATKPEFSLSDQPRLEKRAGFTVAGCEVRNTMDPQKMEQTWLDFFKYLPEITSAIGDVYYGVNYVDKDFDPKLDKGYGYIACTEIKPGEKLPEGVILHKVPEAEYLVFEHTGSVQYLQESFGLIFSKLIPESKYKMIYSDMLEVYGEKSQPDSAESVIEIWIPVMPKEE